MLVIECILNQNARDLGAATYPSMNFEVIGLCMKYHVGMVQIPCPEIACLGFLRKREPGKSIRDALDTEFGRECCRKLARIVGDRVKMYIDNGNRVLAVLGGNPESPGCAVQYKMENSDNGISEKSGIFMQALFWELSQKHIYLPFIGIRDCRPEWLESDLHSLELIIRR
nr:hypothetical protein [Desulfobacula sp.]